MNLFKTSFFNAIAVAVKMATMLSLNKLLAVYIGPAGFATIGQFHNAIQIITTFANGAVNNGVIKYTAEYYDNERRQHLLWKTAGSISIFGSLFIGIFIIVLNRQLARFILNEENYGSIFIWFSVALLPFVFNSLMLAILNGKKEVGRYVVSNITSSIIILIVTAWLTIFYGLYGALLALAVFQSIAFFVTLYICSRAKWFSFKYIIGKIDKQIAKNLAMYTLMALTSAICVPLSQILVRNHLGATFGWVAAGYWEAMWRLSGAYLLLITTTLSVYYLPKLSELNNKKEIIQEIFLGYKIILPVAGIFSFCVYFFRDLIVVALFTEDFLQMRELFAWHLIGDTLKIGSWILSYLMIGKAMVKLFVLSEIIFNFIFVIFTVIFTNLFGLKGVAIAHAGNYLIYWVVLAIFIKSYLSKNDTTTSNQISKPIIQPVNFRHLKD